MRICRENFWNLLLSAASLHGIKSHARVESLSVWQRNIHYYLFEKWILLSRFTLIYFIFRKISFDTSLNVRPYFFLEAATTSFLKECVHFLTGDVLALNGFEVAPSIMSLIYIVYFGRLIRCRLRVDLLLFCKKNLMSQILIKYYL